MKVKHLIFILFIFSTACRKDVPSPLIISFTPGKGAPGIRVTIRGTHFGDTSLNATVSFNGIPGKIYYLKDSIIEAEVPQGATTGKITVSANGRSGTSSDDFIILPGKWVRKADIPITYFGRSGGIGFSIGNKGYFGQGSENPIYINDFWEYDPLTNNWQQKPSIPLTSSEGFYLSVSIVINNKAYVGVGNSRNAAISDQWWEYDPITNQWTRKADFPGAIRWAAVGISSGTKGYVGLGFSLNAVAGLTDWWEYDPATNQWSAKKDFPGLPRYDPTGFHLNGAIYVGSGSYDYQKDWWQYNYSSDTWTKKSDFPGTVTFDPSGFVIEDKGYIAGGGTECWEYNSLNDSWRQVAFFGSRISGSVFTIGNKGYYAAGAGSPFLNKDLWEFTPQ